MKFMQKSNEALDKSEKDKFDHFAAFVAASLRDKPPNVADECIRAITNLIFS